MTMGVKSVRGRGSAEGGGRYVAERVEMDGARVIVHGRDRTRGEALVDRIAKRGGEALLLIADLSSLAGVRSLADAARSDGRGPRALGNNSRVRTSREGTGLKHDGF